MDECIAGMTVCLPLLLFLSPWLFEGWNRVLVLRSGLLVIKERVMEGTFRVQGHSSNKLAE